MPEPCKACRHPDRPELDLALAQNQVSLTVLAVRYGLEPGCIRRHKEAHFRPILPTVLAVKTDPVTLLQELDVVKSAAQRYMAQAESEGKVMHWRCANCGTEQSRVEGSNLSLALKALREYRETIQVTIGIASDLGVLAPHSKKFEKGVRAILIALEPYPEAKEAVLVALREMDG